MLRQGTITYSITGNTNGYTESTTTNNQTYTFTDLSEDTYTVKVTTQSLCEYTEQVTIADEEKYTVSTVTEETTCGQNNGTVSITVSSGNVSGSITSTGSFGYLNVEGDSVIAGNLTFGDADSDSVSFGADISSSLFMISSIVFGRGKSLPSSSILKMCAD